MTSKTEDKKTKRRISKTKAPKGSNIKEIVAERSLIFKSRYNLILTFILLIIAIVIYDSALISFDRIDIDNLQNDLNTQIVRQKDAVELVLNSIKTFHDNPQLHIINFIGPSGVGKSFIANLIKKHFHASTFEVIGPFGNDDKHLKLMTNILPKFTKYNLIIIDDLTILDIEFLHTLIKKIPTDVPVLVICIFNIQETDSELNSNINYSHIDIISNESKKLEIPLNNVIFHEFTYDDVRNWLTDQLKQKNIDSFEIINSIVNDHSVKSLGLKGLQSKLLKM